MVMHYDSSRKVVQDASRIQVKRSGTAILYHPDSNWMQTYCK